MTPARCNTVCLLVMALALSLTALALVALACGPSAPAAQDNATPTPEPTATAAAASTPTHQAELSAMVHAVMVKQATITAQGANGTTGEYIPQRPQTIDVDIYTHNPHSADVKAFLENHELVERTEMTCGSECTVFTSVQVPVSLLQSLSQQDGVILINTIEKYYESLDKELNLIVAQYDAGLITAAEAVAEPRLISWGERILLAADFDTSANAASAIRYLKDNGVYMMEHPVETTVVGGFIPVSLILPLSQQPGVIAVTGIGYGADLADPDVQKSLNRYKPPRPTSAGGPVQGQAVAPPLTPAPMRRQFLPWP